MLTGDKVGTAMNIARACNILPREAQIFELTADQFPVLGQLSTADMIEVQEREEPARERERERRAQAHAQAPTQTQASTRAGTRAGTHTDKDTDRHRH